jgi:preprotein translocase SecE subunit
MAVAEKKELVVETGGTVASLASASVLGTLYVIAAFFLVYHGLYFVWETYLGGGDGAGLFQKALLLLLMLVGTAAAILLFPRVVSPQHGLRAGVAAGVVYLFLGFWIVYGVARAVEAWLNPSPMVGAAIVAVLALVVLYFGWNKLRTERMENRLRDMEDHGWFSFSTYKKGQGLKMRRGTMLGVLLLVVSGIWVYAWKYGLAESPPWVLPAPFLNPNEYELVILRSPVVIMPLIVLALAVWFAYRLVNYPRFADFLIATEAEMNKVSWASQKKLVQDTIVVLITVVLMAVFLFLVDLLWSRILTWIDVIRF